MPNNKPVKYVPASPNYEAFFQNGLSSEGEDLYMYEKDNHDQDSHGGPDEQRRPAKPRSLTAVVWDKTKYEGTPLQLEDERLGSVVKWIKAHNLTIVKLDSIKKVGSFALSQIFHVLTEIW